MKKYFPLLLFLTVFSGFLVGQILFDLVDLSAGLSTREKTLRKHYQSTLDGLSLEIKNFDDPDYFKTVLQDTATEFRVQQTKAPVVILNFWASWCHPCLKEFPSLVEMKKNFSDDEVMIFGINNDHEDQISMMKQIKEKFHLNFPLYADRSGKITNEFLVSSLPFSIIFHKGQVVEVSKGAKDFSSKETIEKIRNLIY